MTRHYRNIVVIICAACSAWPRVPNASVQVLMLGQRVLSLGTGLPFGYPQVGNTVKNRRTQKISDAWLQGEKISLLPFWPSSVISFKAFSRLN